MRGLVIFLMAFALIFTSCKTTRKVIVDEEKKESVDSVSVEVKKEEHRTEISIEEAIKTIIEHKSEGDLKIYDTSRMYEEDGEMKAPLLVHYVTKDSTKVTKETDVTTGIKDEGNVTDSIFVAKNVDRESEYHKTTDTRAGTRMALPLVIVFVILLLLCLFKVKY